MGLCICTLLCGCNFFESESSARAVAKVGAQYLHAEDLLSVSHPNQSPADSSATVQQFINDWIKGRLVLEKAELNIARSQEVEERVEDYRNQLLVHHYQQALIDQKLDTTITNLQYERYYEDHGFDYVLQYPVYQLRLVLVPDNTPGLQTFAQKLKDIDEAELDLKEDCIQYAVTCELNSNKWNAGPSVEAELGLGPGALVKYPKRKVISLPLSQGRVAFFEIFDTRKAGEQAPMSFVLPQIKATILEKRKNELLENMRNELYKRAFSRGHAEIF